MKMKPVFVALIAITFGTGLTAAQNMVEYTNPPTKSAISQKAAENRTAGSSDKSAAKPSSQKKTAADNSQPISAPTPPAIFILSNGERLQAKRYTLTVDSLRIQDDGAERTIPLSAVDVKATTALNHERGLDLDFPKSKSQMTLSF
jgi:hypothetical protein